MNEPTVEQPTEQEARGLALLKGKNKKAHPRAQVQSLRRIAVRADSDADWMAGIPTKRHPRPPKPVSQGPAADAERRAHIAAQRQKVQDALAACLYLNRVHVLGYPVPAR